MFWPLRRRPRGLIAHLRLGAWWNNLPKAEQTAILKLYQPLGGADILSGNVLESGYTAARFLSGLAQWLLKEEPHLAFAISQEAQVRIANETPDDLLFIYSDLACAYYRLRKTIPEASELCEKMCRLQIAIADDAINALKAHDKQMRVKHIRPMLQGYEKLTLLLESEGRFEEALRIQLEGENRKLTSIAEGRKSRLLKKISKQ